MSYEFVRLSEVEQVESANNANLLIEENGEIKRLSTENLNLGSNGATAQIQADWNETDESSPAFIWNKPNVNLGVINITTDDSGNAFIDGTPINSSQVLNFWENGANVRVNGKVVVDMGYIDDYGGNISVYYASGGSIMNMWIPW